MAENAKKVSWEQVVRAIRRQTRRKFSADEKIRIVLEMLQGETRIADLCRRESMNPNQYYTWSKEFLEAGKRLKGDKLCAENGQLKQVTAELPSAQNNCISNPLPTSR